ncbi:MAG: phosphoribosyl-ATP diphosphatase [Spirochaetaceae bacterium]|jgi:phosphoribosyl-ATP pyrophosphohydrolase/phosphoribosyl-AMP cyclohydrolase|nr:phosphoribosyl-ATP diphosphatase [Spirochaetaceae bacterium]
MVIASIDIQQGRVVQLKQGRELVLQQDNATELAETFDRYGEVAVIDLDGAMGRGSNGDLIKPLLRKAQCRVGGGIRTVEQARELVSLGAQQIIIGSQALERPGARGAAFRLNQDFLKALGTEIGRERVMVAIDAQSREPGNYEIVIDGWKTPTGLGLIETAQALEPFVGALLFTGVEREGTMQGIDLATVKDLREGVSCGLTVAGGVSTLEEIEALAALGCDVQLGMALYTGRIDLGEAFIRSLNWEKGASPQGALLPVIAQSPDGQVMMTGFADKTAVAESFKRGKLCFHSRTRNTLWMKGEGSGNTLALRKLRADCDRDALLAVVEPAGPVCHTGNYSCFETRRRYTWEYLQSIIADRFRNPCPGSYTATLDDPLVREKIMEEAQEVCTAKTHGEVVWEAADLLFFTTALMTREGVTVAEVLDELDRRHTCGVHNRRPPREG